MRRHVRGIAATLLRHCKFNTMIGTGTKHLFYCSSLNMVDIQRYHVPRSWLNPQENLLVLHEEIGGDPTKVSVLTRTGQEICAHVTQKDPPQVDTLKPKSFDSWVPQVQLECEKGWRITSVSFASFGTPKGSCGTFTQGACHADVLAIVKKVSFPLFIS